MIEGWKRNLALAARANRELLARMRRGDDLPADVARLLWHLDHASMHTRAKKAAREAAHVARTFIPYHFEGPTHRIASVDEVLRRGYGACADAAAAIGAVFLDRWSRLGLCYEVVDSLPEYAHVRVHVDGAPAEPWPERRRPEARGCLFLDDVSALLRDVS